MLSNNTSYPLRLRNRPSAPPVDYPYYVHSIKLARASQKRRLHLHLHKIFWDLHSNSGKEHQSVSFGMTAMS